MFEKNTNAHQCQNIPQIKIFGSICVILKEFVPYLIDGFQDLGQKRCPHGKRGHLEF